MDAIDMEKESTDQLSGSSLPFARSYQIEALEKAIKQNTIVFLETGSGKTLIAIMLLRSYAHLLRKPSPHFAVFLVPQVVLVTQQAEALKMHTDLQVGMYWGDMGVDFWDATTWKQEVDKYEVLVMTPAILLNALRHSFLKLELIKVLIFDECHHARGNHPYACIMKDFYHKELKSGSLTIPRIFGMTASPVKSKGANLGNYWKPINELETLMNAKVYTCCNESELAAFVPFSTPKFKLYQQMEIPCLVRESLEEELKALERKHRLSVATLDLEPSIADSVERKISKICSNLLYCLDELGIWMAQKAADSLSSNQNDFFPWGLLDTSSRTITKKFCLDASKAFLAYIPSDPSWSIADNVKGSLDAGLLTSKAVCLIESLLEYSELKNIRCIIFVERILTATVLDSLLGKILPKYNNWKTKYMAGDSSGLQYQTRKKQNEIVDDFRKGLVNIIVATSILEEGLDVQSCNLVIRFDPSPTVCSFIQSRGRARMQKSDYLMMVQSGDLSTQSRLMNYLSSGDRMRAVSLLHASVPCKPLPDDTCEDFYRVASTGAIVTLSSSGSLIHFYCSRLPSDGYYKPTPRFDIDKDGGTCTLYFPKNCPLKPVKVKGLAHTLKQAACLEACKQLHKNGALTDNLVPDMVVEEAVTQELCNITYNDQQPCYFPPELVGCFEATYHFYVIRLKPDYPDEIHVRDILLGTRVKLEDDIENIGFDLGVKGGTVTVTLEYTGVFLLTQEEVLSCRRFQITLLRLLLDRNLEKLTVALDGLERKDEPTLDFLLLPSNQGHQTSLINWEVIKSVNFSCHIGRKSRFNCSACDSSRILHTKDGLVCTCEVQNALVYTPHNGKIYCITGVLNDVNANSLLTMRDGSSKTYSHHYETEHSIKLVFVDEPLLLGRHIFTVHNYFQRSKKRKEKEEGKAFVELPPELCSVILSPVSVDTIYSYTFVPTIMHRLESLLIAYNLKKMHIEHNTQQAMIPTVKILEAITTKKCQDRFNLELLETLGDSFLKYAVSQHLFKTYKHLHEGLLSSKRERIIKNSMLCNLGCERKLQGFIRNEFFEPKMWMVPGQASETYALTEERLSDWRIIYIARKRDVKRKTVADVVEALIGAYLSEGGELAAVMFMDWVGIKVDFSNVPYQRESLPCAEKLLNVGYIESLLNYKFQDRSLLVEALTHGSYMLPEIPRCYQRLEFLGDSVLDYLITKYLYDKYPSLGPGLLTDLRSASVNNDFYAQAAVRAQLHKHILHASHDLHKHITTTVHEFEQLSSKTFGWETEASLPKVLADIIESLAGAILVDSGYNIEAVFASIQPLMGCMVTPETLQINPVRELTELCRREHFEIKESEKFKNGKVHFTVTVNAKGDEFVHTAEAPHKKMAEKLAHKEVLNSLKIAGFKVST